MDDSVKVNLDATVDKYKWKLGSGVIIKDRMGEMLATLSTPKDYIIDPNLAEARAAFRATTFIFEMGFSKVVFKMYMH
jgi:cell division protein FtsI/penicillin-binding protein 2